MDVCEEFENLIEEEFSRLADGEIYLQRCISGYGDAYYVDTPYSKDTLDTTFEHGGFTYNCRCPYDGKSVFLFVQSDPHAEKYATYVTCSVGRREWETLTDAASKGLKKVCTVIDQLSVPYLWDDSWQHIAFLLPSQSVADIVARALEKSTYKLISEVSVLWAKTKKENE